ncbi:hypothetical protein ACQ4PT_047036 [Festuca glaucescens]
METAAVGASIQGGADTILVEAAMAAAVAGMGMLEVPLFRGDGMLRDLVMAGLGTELAVGFKVGLPVAAPNPTAQQKGTAQGIPEGNEVAAKGKDNEGQGPPPKKKEDKAGCFRCKKPGHYIDDCQMPFCDICESIHHATPACHLLNAPKPSATLHGYANEALMFFELPCGAFKAKAENPKLAKVTVDGAVLTIPEIIEQLKKIVPSEKFNWEVFHLKDNIFRVKLPSKQEVQRLKNFGTYIYTDRESSLSFDLWSSLEEPLYMLPEVWVRVSGLPSDVRADYLSLWGVGTLFGKTLDADMAYTHKNKVLRTKIGCLDYKLISADSDMFIRRGFFKLGFEVEMAAQSEEVNMVDANNGLNGNDGANQGEKKFGGGHEMDMDNKGNDMDATSKNDEQDDSSMHNGGDRMQEQLCNLDAIQIGTMHVKLAPTDALYRGSSSGSVAARDRDLRPESAVGQPMVTGLTTPHAANGEDLLHAGRQKQQELPVPSCLLSSGASARERDSHAGPVGHRRADACGRDAAEGSSLAVENLSTASVSPGPQKIQRKGAGGTDFSAGIGANHLPMIGTAVSGVAAAVGSVVHPVVVDKGMCSDPMEEKNKLLVRMGNVELCSTDFISNSLHGKDEFCDAGLDGDCLISNG